MDIGLLGQGTVLGFTIAAAVGPIALLVIRRTLGAGWALGMASGLGVATADGLYGAVAAFGLTAISDILVALARPLGLLGGAVLVVLGLRTLRSPPTVPVAGETPPSRGLPAALLSTLVLTLTNPMTLILFAAIVAGLGVPPGPDGAALLAAGFFVGSAAWWLVLVTGISALRSRVTPRLLHRITLVSGLLIAGFGALSMASAIRG